MCQSQKFVATSGIANVTIQNNALDGTGPMNLVLTAILDGTVLQTITIKATASNAQGIIRLFIQPSGGGTKYVWREIPVPANVQSGTIPAYQTTVRASFTLQSGDELWASTQNNETWNILAEGVSWENCACPS